MAARGTHARRPSLLQAFYYASFLNVTILASTITLVLETIYLKPYLWFALDSLYIWVFTFDLVVRLLTVPDWASFGKGEPNSANFPTGRTKC